MNGSPDPMERLSQTLESLYRSCGYRQYKMSKFEEYDLYAQNRNFLTDERILTFTDLNGRLMALKPDVTLSVINNTRPGSETRKVWYTENVYRSPRNGDSFQEIRQTGLECIGAVDLYTMAEVLMLAGRSLAAAGRDYVLSLSHVGLAAGVLRAVAVPAERWSAALAAVGGRNRHEVRSLCPGEAGELLSALCAVSGPAAEALPGVLALPLPEESRAAAEELQKLCSVLNAFGGVAAELDLSLVNDTDYYNGLLFRGYVDGAAAPVLSGGRYDHLLHRMGREGSAVGFAVYLSELERLLRQREEFDADTVLFYSPSDDPAAVAAEAQRRRAAGESVCVLPLGKTELRSRRRVDVKGNEVD